LCRRHQNKKEKKRKEKKRKEKKRKEKKRKEKKRKEKKMKEKKRNKLNALRSLPSVKSAGQIQKLRRNFYSHLQVGGDEEGKMLICCSVKVERLDQSERRMGGGENAYVWRHDMTVNGN
jgi:hypothetical protein